MGFELDYDAMSMLDAEELAEGGLGAAYRALLPKLRRYVAEPDAIEEIIDDAQPSYTVVHRGARYAIHAPGIEREDSWGRATYALFAIVNAQLSGVEQHFYAINGGNDLGGMFLTPAEYEAARRSLPERRDGPYIPTLEAPWYGQPHD